MTFPRGGIVRLRARAFTLLFSKVRVFEDGVNPSQPEGSNVIGPGAGVWGRNSPAFAESHSIAERVTRIEKGRS